MWGHSKGYNKTKLIRANLFHVRTKMGLTCQQVADMIGVNKGYYVRIENAVVSPSAELMERICNVLAVTNNKFELFDTYIVTDNLNEEEKNVLDMLKASGESLSQRQKEMLIKYIQCKK